MKPWFKSKFRYIAVTLIAFLLTAGITNAVGMFRYDANHKKLIFDDNLNIKSRAIAAFQVWRIISLPQSNGGDLTIKSRQDFRIKVGGSCPVGTTLENCNKFSVNNGNNENILSISENGEVKFGIPANILLTISDTGISPKLNLISSGLDSEYAGVHFKTNGNNFSIENLNGNINLLDSSSAGTINAGALRVTGSAHDLILMQSPVFTNLGNPAAGVAPCGSNCTNWNGLGLSTVPNPTIGTGTDFTISAGIINLSSNIYLNVNPSNVKQKTDSLNFKSTRAFGGMFELSGVCEAGNPYFDQALVNLYHSEDAGARPSDTPTSDGFSPTVDASGNPSDQLHDANSWYCYCPDPYIRKLLLSRAAAGSLSGYNWYWCYKP